MLILLFPVILFIITMFSALNLGLYGGYVSFFVMEHNKKLLVNDKLTLCQTEYVDPNIISKRYKQQN